MENRSSSKESCQWISQCLAHVRLLLGYFLLPNILFWVAALMLDTLPRAAFNIDYVIVGALVPFCGLWFGIALISAAVLADVFRSCGSLYYFTQRDAFSALAFIGELSPWRVLGIVSAAMLLIFGWSSLLVFVGGRQKQLRYRTSWLSAAVVLLASLAVWGGNSSIRFSDDPGSQNLASSSGLSMVKTVYGAVIRRPDRLPPRAVDSATRRAGWFQQLPMKRNLVLVVVESWGQAANPAWNEAVTAPLHDARISARYEVEFGTVPFRGPTVPAELRELCGILSSVTQRPTDDSSLMRNCIPNRLSDHGYETMFLHGFDPHMFDRGSWSRKLGFQRLLFRPDLQKLGIRKCDGPFAGACDDDVARWIGDQLVAEQSQSKFFYLLTLNSHLPIRSPEGMGNPLGCGTKETRIADQPSCELLTLILRVHDAFAKVAERPDLPPTEFILVGDHAPPFLYKSRRDRFSQTEVPFVHLTPRPPAENIRTSRK